MNNNKILHKVDNKKEILINKMYVGRYLTNNIGHEIINLIKADNDKNYIYVNPYGSMDKIHNDKIDTILLVRNCNIKDTFEILAQAWDLQQVVYTDKTLNKEEINKIQLKYIQDNNVKYKGKYLNEIFYENEKDKEATYITFYAKQLRRPKKPIYICFDCFGTNKKDIENNNSRYILKYLNCIKSSKKDNENKNNIVNIAKQSLKMYIKNNEVKYGNKIVDQSIVFEKLKRVIENPNYWEKQNSIKKVEKISKEEKNTELNKFNFIDIIDRNYDEVIFSNMFQYIFSANTEVFCSFAKTVLKSDLKNNKLNLSQKFIIERERGHTDLLITDKENKNIIVIENKIKSGINGKEFIIGEEKIKGQLYDYCYYVKGYIRGNIQEGKYIIDKETGVKYIENKDLKREFELYKNKFFYIFVPNYSYINERNIYPKNTYKIIKYSQIYDFFNKQKNSFKEILYFKEFLYALKKHISNTDNILERTMHKRFIDVINNKS